MLQKVALALKAANEKHYAVLKINAHDMTWEVWVEGKAAEVNFKNHSDAFTRCETLNYEYAARKAVEALKGTGYFYSINEWINEILK